MINIDELITLARKNGEKVRLTVLTNFKSKVTEFKTAVNAKPYTEAVEVSILSKMAKELAEDIETATKNGRTDRIKEPTEQLAIVKEYLPKMATREEIEEVVKTSPNFVDGKITQKEMGIVIKYVKSKLSNADGKLTSEVVRSFIG